MASGDIDLRAICNALGDVKTKWFEIGIQLGIPRSKLMEFKKGDDPLSAVVDYWLRGNVTEADISWKSIVAALKSTHVGETGLADQIRKKYCQHKDCQHEETMDEKVTGKTSQQDTPSPDDKLSPAIKEDLKFILTKNLKAIINKYGSYVDCLRNMLQDKGVSQQNLRSYLLSIVATSETFKGQKLTLLSDKKQQLEKCDTLNDIFDLLTTECASFLHYDVFQSILKNYEISEDKERLKYSEYLIAYVKKHTISEFTQVNPLLKTRNGCKELVLKFDIETTCRLAKVVELKTIIAEILDLSPSTFEIVDIEDGCVVVTFLIPTSIADVIFTPNRVFTPQQQDKLRKTKVQWLKCNGHTYHLGKIDTTVTVFTKLEEQLTCSVCLELYTNPKQLQCNHVYCQKCLEQQGQLTLTCPNCRQITPIPASGVAGLQPAFQINTILEIVKEHKKAKDSPARAESAFTSPTSHGNIIVVCPEHDGKKAELYCETCEKTICLKCAIKGGKHHSHNCKELDEAFEQYKKEITSSLEPLEKQLTTIEEALKVFDTRHDEISDQRATIKTDIHNTITRLQARLHQRLEIRKTELISQLDQLTQAKLKSLAAQRDQIETTQTQLSSCLLFMRENLKTGNQGEALMMKSNTIRQITELITTCLPDMLEPNTEADLIFSALADLSAECQNYGEVYAAGSLDPSKCHVTGKGAAVGGRTRAALVSARPMDKLGTPILTIINNTKLKGVAFNQRKEVVLTEWDRHCVTVFSPSGERLRSFGTQGTNPGEFKYPYGVAVDGEGNILVADYNNNRIQKFTAQEEVVECFRVSLPRGITVSASNGRIYVVEGGTNRIKILNSDFRYVGTFGDKGEDKGQFKDPQHIACDSTGNVYVADSNNHRIQVFTAKGKFLRMFGRHGDGRGELNGPFGIAIDSSDRVYVGEYNNHRVSVFTSEGQFMTSFGSEGKGPGQFKCPHGLAVDSSGVVGVCDYNNSRVQLF